MPRPDAALEVALEQRRRRLDVARQELAALERALLDEQARLDECRAGLAAMLAQLDEVQSPPAGHALDVFVVHDVERLVELRERDVWVQGQRATAAAEATIGGREQVAAAHQQVRALELVIEARAAARRAIVRRNEVRHADEIAAQAFARRPALQGSR